MCSWSPPVAENDQSQFKRHGFDEIALNLHFLPEAIEGHFADGARWGVRLTYSREPQLLGTAGGTKKMEAFFQGDRPFLVYYGDILTNQDFTAMLHFHQQQEALATLLVHRRAGSNSAVSVDATGRIERFLERPSAAQRDALAGAWVFSGITICQPELLDLIPPQTSCDFPRDVFVRLTAARRLFAFPLTGQRTAVDSPERLAEARQAVAQGMFPTEA